MNLKNYIYEYICKDVDVINLIFYYKDLMESVLKKMKMNEEFLTNYEYSPLYFDENYFQSFISFTSLKNRTHLNLLYEYNKSNNVFTINGYRYNFELTTYQKIFKAINYI
jgi:hypothetical protein